MDIVHEYVRFIFSEWEKDPYSPIATKNPPSVAEYRKWLIDEHIYNLGG